MGKRKRSPQDATLRNVRASRRRDRELRMRLAVLEQRVLTLEDAIEAITGSLTRAMQPTVTRRRLLESLTRR